MEAVTVDLAWRPYPTAPTIPVLFGQHIAKDGLFFCQPSTVLLIWINIFFFAVLCVKIEEHRASFL
jgi:hypothetical protein